MEYDCEKEIPLKIDLQNAATAADYVPLCVNEFWTHQCTIVTEWGDWMTREENQLSVQMIFFLGGFGLLYFCMYYCQICVFGVLLFCIITCLQYRLMNLLLWASILVLWTRGWSFRTGSLSLSWS